MEICTLASSSSGNCALVSHGKTHILIDAGISMRRIKEGLRTAGIEPSELEGVLVTHGHSDHTAGLKMLMKHYKTPVYASWGTCGEICAAAPEAEPYMNCFEPGIELELADIAVRSFPTMHDSAESVGYVLCAGGAKLAFVTDLGRVTNEVLGAAQGADMAVIEANHDVDLLKNGRYPQFLKRRILSEYGHLSNSASGRLAARLADSGTRYIMLAHLSRENNTPGLARHTVEDTLRTVSVTIGRDVTLDVAPPDSLSERYIINA